MTKQFIVGLVAGTLAISTVSVVSAAPLVGYWAFEEGAGSAILDSSGNSIDGTIVGSGVTRVPGFVGQALSFDDSSSHVLIPHQSLLDNQDTAFSVTFFINGPAIQTGNDSLLFDAIDKSHRGTDFTGWTFQGGNDSGGGFTFHVGNGVNAFRSVAISGVLDDIWHAVAVTVTTTGVKAYVDGSLQAQNNAADTIGTNTGNLIFGTHFALDRDYAGLLDEVRIFNGELTPTEVGDLAHGLTPVPIPATIWLFGSALVGLGVFRHRKKLA